MGRNAVEFCAIGGQGYRHVMAAHGWVKLVWHGLTQPAFNKFNEFTNDWQGQYDRLPRVQISYNFLSKVFYHTNIQNNFLQRTTYHYQLLNAVWLQMIMTFAFRNKMSLPYENKYRTNMYSPSIVKFEQWYCYMYGGLTSLENMLQPTSNWK